jgi:hypothetical protein
MTEVEEQCVQPAIALLEINFPDISWRDFSVTIERVVDKIK